MVATCIVSYRDAGGVEHAVEVVATSLYEAASLALAAFNSAKMTENGPGLATILDVTVHLPAVTHRVRVRQVKEWLNRGATSPRESLLKSRLKERVGE